MTLSKRDHSRYKTILVILIISISVLRSRHLSKYSTQKTNVNRRSDLLLDDVPSVVKASVSWIDRPLDPRSIRKLPEPIRYRLHSILSQLMSLKASSRWAITATDLYVNRPLAPCTNKHCILLWTHKTGLGINDSIVFNLFALRRACHNVQSLNTRVWPVISNSPSLWNHYTL